MKIHIALVHHRHGTNTYAAASAEELDAKILEYVQDQDGFAEETDVQAYFADEMVSLSEHLDLITTDLENPLLAPMQWLLDDLHDADETHDQRDGSIFDSVESAAAALVENGGSLDWYSLDETIRYRERRAAA